nr:UPF0182 family protein [Allonocardiopsis opalescens]
MPVVAAVVILVMLVVLYASFWTDYLWFRSVDYTEVFLTQLRTQAIMFAAGAAVMGLFVGVNTYIAYRVRPTYRPFSLEQQGLERYRMTIDPLRRMIFWGLVGVLALMAGASAAGGWQTWLTFSNQEPFGVTDQQFGTDISFFMFTYPFIRLVMSYLFGGVILALITSVITHYVYGGVRLQTQGERATPAARVHLSVLLGIFVLLKAVAYWLDTYGLAYSERGYVHGPSYTDVNALLPAKYILAGIAVICALLFFANIIRRGAMLPIVGLLMLGISAFLLGVAYPAIVQQFQVQPNEARMEEPYIERNIEATRAAYDVADAEIIDYNANTELTPNELASEAETISGVRLLDPNVVSTAYQQLQQIRGFYEFPEQLDVDRYPDAEGNLRDTVIAAREMGAVPADQDNWINRHLVYTHGYGLVAAPGSEVDDTGRPAFIERDIPSSGELGIDQPRIYFGERTSDYAIVGAPEGAAPREYDYPDEASGGQQSYTYTGDSGVPVGGFFNRLLYAIVLRDANFLLSTSELNSESQILLNREPRERIQQVAPFLSLDGNPYPAVVDGRIVWIVDAYTVSDAYPYSQRVSFGEATSDTSTQTGAVQQQPTDRLNYIRNSVKATVDAYTGEVNLYEWDTEDPVLHTWMNAFPSVVQEHEEIPQELLQHFRYPEDLFKVQRHILAQYHVTEPGAFYSGGDFWLVPDDPTQESGISQPPYYLTVQMPCPSRPEDNAEAAEGGGAAEEPPSETEGAEADQCDPEPRFSLTSAFVPRDRPNLAAFMAVSSAPGEDYGQIQLLQLPTDSPIQGPGQVQNSFNSDTEVADTLNVLRIGDSETINGNLLTLPFGGGLLYVQPVYVQSTESQAEPYPVLRRVLVLYGGSIGFGTNLQDALNQVFEGDPSELPEDLEGVEGGTVSPEVRAALNDATAAYEAGQEALQAGDFAAYGEANEDLAAALEQAARLMGGGSQVDDSGTAEPSPAPSPEGE